VSRYELTKTIEVRKLNKRSGLPLPEPPVLIPFGSMIENLKRERGSVQFTHLFELFEISETVLDSAIREVGAARSEQASTYSAPPARAEPSGEVDAVGAPGFVWQEVSAAPIRLLRAKVPGGWLLSSNGAVSFYSDPEHAWDGRSME
jgi:hypothetical protein